jgi:hypothetical protein
MNDANEKDEDVETLRGATDRIFRMQCFTHAHLHSNLSIPNFATTLKRHTVVGAAQIQFGVTVSVIIQRKNIFVA